MTVSDAPSGEDVDSSPEFPPHRRSTYTPPGQIPVDLGEAQGTDDDALATALAAELDRATRTGSIPIQQPAPEYPDFFGTADETAEAPEPTMVEPAAQSEVPVWSLDDEPTVASPFPFVTDASAETPADPAPFFDATSMPSPEPAPAVEPIPAPELTPSTLAPPQRLSLPDEALVQWIATEGDGATLDAMEQLERELQLRQQDAQSFAEWEQSMLALGTSEALNAVNQARTGFADVVSPSTAATVFIPPVPQQAPQPQPAADLPPAEQFAVEQPVIPEFDEDPLVAPQIVVPQFVEPQFNEFPPATMPEDFDIVHNHEDAAELNSDQLADLAHAPAPQSLPYSDIPPPLADSEPMEWPAGVAVSPELPVAPVTPVTPGIPDLIEPHSIGDEPLPAGHTFDSLLADAGLAHADVMDGETETDAVSPAADDDEIFPLAVHEPGEAIPVTIDHVAPRAFRIEFAGLEPSPIEQRIGRSARLFWMWFAANSSVLSVGLGAILFSLGVSLRQAIIAALVGVCISSLPLGIGALAGKRSGQPTMVVSRATFGLVGNVLPALLAFVTRVFWGAVMLWALALGVAAVLGGVGAVSLDPMTLALVSLAVALVLATVIAVFGYGLIARVQLTLTIASAVLVVGFVMLSWPAVNLREAISMPDGDWMLVATASVLVFSFVGLVWAVSSADVARYQNPHSSSAGSMLWSWSGAALPAFTLIAYGALLAASSPELATGLLNEPLETLSLLVPSWYLYPLLAVIALGLLSGAIMAIYSGGFALQAVGVGASRVVVVIIVAVLTGAAAAGILFTLTDFETLMRDLATTIAVPIAAWVGVFSAELMMRARRFDSPSLLRRGGVYADVRWVNLVTLIIASAVGYAFTSAAVSWLNWQGFGWNLLGIEADSVLANTDVGVIGALVLALLVTVIVGKPGINAQERSDRDETFETAPAAEATQPVDYAELD